MSRTGMSYVKSVLQCVAVCCRYTLAPQSLVTHYSAAQMCCSVLQRVAVCCSVLPCVAVC